MRFFFANVNERSFASYFPISGLYFSTPFEPLTPIKIFWQSKNLPKTSEVCTTLVHVRGILDGCISKSFSYFLSLCPVLNNYLILKYNVHLLYRNKFNDDIILRIRVFSSRNVLNRTNLWY